MKRFALRCPDTRWWLSTHPGVEESRLFSKMEAEAATFSTEREAKLYGDELALDVCDLERASLDDEPAANPT